MKHKIVALLICFIVVAFASNIANAADWAAYRHDNARSGSTDEWLIPPLSLHWKFTPTHAPRPAWMKPAEEMERMHFDSAYHVTAAKGMVYFGSSVDDKVYALDAVTGDVRWTFFTDGPVRFAPALAGDKVYFGSDDGYVYCLRAKNGRLVWKYRAGPSGERVIGNGRMISLWPVRTSVLVDEGVVYSGAGVFPYEGIYICALNAEDGTVVWKNDTIGDHSHELAFGGMSPQSYLVASGNILYVPSGRAMPAAFDRKSGRFLYFCAPGSKVGGSWALVSEGELIAGVDRSGVPAKVAYEDGTGKRKGDVYAWFPGIDMVVTPKVAYTISEDGIYAIDRTSYPDASNKLSALRQQRKELGATLTDLRGKLSKAADEADPNIQVVDKITEQINKLAAEEETLLKVMACKWQYAKKDLSSLILAGDTLFAGGKGIVIAVHAEKGNKLWSSEVEGTALGLGVSDRNLFVSTDKGPIYCFGEKMVSEAKMIKAEINPSPYPEDDLTAVYKSGAETILKETGIKKGYCLVLDCGTGRLAYELAKRTELNIVGIESNVRKAKQARDFLDSAGLYGSRVVVEQWEISDLPDYFANLIVSDATIAPRKASGWSEDILRVLRPQGGVVYIPDISSWMPMPKDVSSTRESSLKNVASIATRGKLEGAGSWTQLYANPQNTACSDDLLVKAPLGVLWFGEPGPENMVERHARATSPVSIGGRLFVQGEEIIMAYDAYNGTPLWERSIPGAVRVRADVDGGNLSATEDGLYVAANDKCYRLDPATGETMREYEMPESPDGSPRRWGYISCVDGILFGSTATPMRNEYAVFWKKFVGKDGRWKSSEDVPKEYKVQYERYIAMFPEPNEEALAELHRGSALWGPITNFPEWASQSSPKGALTKAMMAADSVFAVDTETGKLLWTHRGSRIANISVAIGDGKVLFADTPVSDEQKKKALEEKQELVSKGVYEESVEAELGPEGADVRSVIVLDAATGKEIWRKPFDLTGCGGDKMCSAYHDGLLLFFGSFSNHDVGLFSNGKLKWRRITAISIEKQDIAWSRPLNYLRRPLVVGDEIIIEPRACNVYTGEIRMRSHPITGKQVEWEFLRPGHSCSVTSAAPNCIMYRSYCMGLVDMAEDRGLTLFGGIRPGCWINLIPANGLVLFPEASSGCTCSFPLRCSVAMKYKGAKQQRDWTVFITHGEQTPVERFAVNFGAPGDMRDDDGNLWFGYPRPKTSYGMKFKLSDKVLPQMGYFCQDSRGVTVADSDKPWLFMSGCLGMSLFEMPLVNKEAGEEPRIYKVRLGFMAQAGDQPGERVFDVKMEGKTVLEGFDVVKEAGAPNKAVIREFGGIEIGDKLTVEFVPKTPNPDMTQAPMINFVEVVR